MKRLIEKTGNTMKKNKLLTIDQIKASLVKFRLKYSQFSDPFFSYPMPTTKYDIDRLYRNKTGKELYKEIDYVFKRYDQEKLNYLKSIFNKV